MKKFCFFLMFILAHDLSAQSTHLVKDIHQGPGNTDIREFIAYKGAALFIEKGWSEKYTALWGTYGTALTTKMIKSFTSVDHTISSSLISYHDQIFFIANDSAHGYELWRTDATPAGTHMVKDINPGPASGVMPTTLGHRIAVLNDKLIFTATDSTHGLELWESDGTEAGTKMMMDFNPAPYGNGFYVTEDAFSIIGNKLFILGRPSNSEDYRIWLTDGTVAGSSVLTDNTLILYSGLIKYQDMILFNADNLTDSVAGLYKIDAVSLQPTLVTPGLFIGYPNCLLNDTLLFLGTDVSDPSWPRNIYATDGTTAYNTPLLDQTNTNLSIRSLVTGNHKGYITTNNTVWETDGTYLFTHPIFTSESVGTSAISSGTVYFKAADSTGVHVWKYNSSSNTQPVKLPEPDDANYTDDPVSARYSSLNYYPIFPYQDGLLTVNIYNTNIGTELYKIGLFPAVVSGIALSTVILCYPNPASGQITFESNDIETISIYDISGKMYGSYTGPGTINLSSLAGGSYIADIHLKNHQNTSVLFTKQ